MTHLFFPSPQDSARPAKAICAGCPVRSECLQTALNDHEAFGIWGGMTTQKREPLWPKWKPKHPPAECGTDAGYYRHLRVTFTPPCDGCRVAHSAAWRARLAGMTPEQREERNAVKREERAARTARRAELKEIAS